MPVKHDMWDASFLHQPRDLGVISFVFEESDRRGRADHGQEIRQNLLFGDLDDGSCPHHSRSPFLEFRSLVTGGFERVCAFERVEKLYKFWSPSLGKIDGIQSMNLNWEV